jgi:hypothetical protein
MARHMAHVREAVTVNYETGTGLRSDFYARRPDRAATGNPRGIAAPPDTRGGSYQVVRGLFGEGAAHGAWGERTGSPPPPMPSFQDLSRRLL